MIYNHFCGNLKTLIIDTSTERSIIIFAEGKEPLLTLPLPIGLRSSQYLFPSLQSGFLKLNWQVSNLKAIGVAVGPGSFTGVRVGVAAAKGLAFAHSIPMVALSSLSGFISPDDGAFISVIDAKIGGLYCLEQRRVGKEIFEISGPQLRKIEELHPDSLLVGPDLKKFNFKRMLEVYPDAHYLAESVSKKIDAGDLKSDVEVLYMRDPVES